MQDIRLREFLRPHNLEHPAVQRGLDPSLCLLPIHTCHHIRWDGTVMHCNACRCTAFLIDLEVEATVIPQGGTVIAFLEGAAEAMLGCELDIFAVRRPV